ncbi:MAG: GNAT family N-acetyltransferase [Salinivirgaceae bacterium]|nr:GNAT family N-acetyltransferase [Salinivirgaceae bacterium]
MIIEEIRAKYFSSEDIKTRVNWINNTKINSSMYFDFLPASVEDTEKWYNQIKNNDKRADFSFVLENDNTVIGMGGITSIDLVNSNAEFYVMVGPDSHGKGYGKKISKWLFNYAFIKFNINKICLYTNDSNIIANKIYEDCGFMLEGKLRKHTFKDGQFIDRRFYGLLKEEWGVTQWKETEVKSIF